MPSPACCSLTSGPVLISATGKQQQVEGKRPSQPQILRVQRAPVSQGGSDSPPEPHKVGVGWWALLSRIRGEPRGRRGQACGFGSSSGARAQVPRPLSGAFPGAGARRRAGVPGGAHTFWSWEGGRGAGHPLILQRNRAPHPPPPPQKLLEPHGGGCRAGSPHPNSRPQVPPIVLVPHRVSPRQDLCFCSLLLAQVGSMWQGWGPSRGSLCVYR